MTNERKIFANQQNSTRSTGPRSARGKLASSQNARKTGLYSRLILMPDDDDEEFKRLGRQLYEEWQPQGPTEQRYVESLRALFWQKRRCYKIESGIFTMYRVAEGKQRGPATAFINDAAQTGALERLTCRESSLDKRIANAIKQLEHLRATRSSRQPSTPVARHY